MADRAKVLDLEKFALMLFCIMLEEQCLKYCKILEKLAKSSCILCHSVDFLRNIFL